MRRNTIVIVLLIGGGTSGLIWQQFKRHPAKVVEEPERRESFSQQLQSLADREELLARSLSRSIPEMAGQVPEELDPSSQELLTNFLSQQDEIQKEFTKVRLDLEEANALKRDPGYAKVLSDMKRSDISRSLEKIRKKMAKNLLFAAAVIAGKCAQDLRAWAAMI